MSKSEIKTKNKLFKEKTNNIDFHLIFDMVSKRFKIF